MFVSPISKLMMDLRSACTFLVARQIWPVLSGFPFCTLPGLEYFCQEIYDRQVVREFLPLCQDCVFRAACCGVSLDYVERFGPSEFGAIGWHRYAKEICALVGAKE
jgi:hypothetical protein